MKNQLLRFGPGLCIALFSGMGSAQTSDAELDALFGVAPDDASTAPAASQSSATPSGQAQPTATPLPVIALPAAQAQPDRPSGGRVIEEIVVTAQKSAQSIQDVPLSVSAMSGEDLAQSGTFDAGGLENFVPNVEIDIDPQAPVIGIRGFATETDNVGFESAVGLAVDDLALARPEFIPDGMFDISRVEVLRGPQGTLFGKNTIAGVITFATTEPGELFEASANATYADPEEQRYEAALNVPLTDDLHSRLAGVYWSTTGDMLNTKLNRTEGDFTQGAGRLKLAAYPGDRWSVRLSTQMSATDADYAPWQLYDAPNTVLSFNRDYDPQVEDDPLNAQGSLNRAGYVTRDSDLSRALVEYDIGDWMGLSGATTTAIIGHAGFDLATMIDIDVSPADIIITDFGVDYAQDSLEWRLSASTDGLFGWGEHVEFVAGVYAFKADMSSNLDTLSGDDLVAFAASPAGIQTLGGPEIDLSPVLDLLPGLVPGIPLNDALYRRFSQRTESAAVFGQMTWDITRRWSLLAGLRMGRETKSAHFDVSQQGGIIAAILGAEEYQAERQRKESDISPKLGVLFALNDDINTYLTWTRGFKGGGFNATAENQTDESGDDLLEFEPEEATSWEAGIKSTLFDGAVRLNTTIYRTDIDNLQVVDFVNSSFQVSNAAKARLQGLEAEFIWLPRWQWLSVTAALGLAEATYLSYPNAEPTQQQSDDGQDTQDLTGRTLANAPELSFNLSPSVTIPLPWGDDLGLRWTVDAALRGDQYSATDLDPHSFQSAHWLIGSRIVVGPADGQWAVVLNGSNLTNKRALDLVMDHSVYDNTFVAQQIPLRSFGLSVQVNF